MEYRSLLKTIVALVFLCFMVVFILNVNMSLIRDSAFAEPNDTPTSTASASPSQTPKIDDGADLALADNILNGLQDHANLRYNDIEVPNVQAIVDAYRDLDYSFVFISRDEFVSMASARETLNKVTENYYRGDTLVFIIMNPNETNPTPNSLTAKIHVKDGDENLDGDIIGPIDESLISKADALTEKHEQRAADRARWIQKAFEYGGIVVATLVAIAILLALMKALWTVTRPSERFKQLLENLKKAREAKAQALERKRTLGKMPAVAKIMDSALDSIGGIKTNLSQLPTGYSTVSDTAKKTLSNVDELVSLMTAGKVPDHLLTSFAPSLRDSLESIQRLTGEDYLLTAAKNQKLWDKGNRPRDKVNTALVRFNEDIDEMFLRIGDSYSLRNKADIEKFNVEKLKVNDLYSDSATKTTPAQTKPAMKPPRKSFFERLMK